MNNFTHSKYQTWYLRHSTILLFMVFVATPTLIGQNVGIGTTSPTGRLTIHDASKNALTLTVPNNVNSNGIAFQNSGLAYTWNILRDNVGSNQADFVINGGNPQSIIEDLPERFRITKDGDIGIGRNNPSTKLDVNGVISANGGNSTDWNAAVGWGNHAAAGYLSGSLTNNRIPRWNGSNLINGALTDNGNNVGLGTTNPPAASLEVSANSSLSDPHILLHENGNDYSRLRFQNNNGSNYWTIAAYIASNHRNDRLNFWNGVGGDVMTITGDGEVGIGVGISPKVPLHVGNARRVLFGIDTLGNGDKLMFLPDLHAFRVGTVATGAASTYWNRDSIGLYSFASGLNTRAQGYGATAMGRDTEATNSYAFASGFFSNADGQYSTAMGFNTDAFALGSTAMGYSTDAEANYSFAAGYFSEAQAIYSIAIGNAVQAQSYASMAVGRYNVGGGNATSWVGSDPIFEVGIGTGPSTRANAITVRKDGNVGIGTTFPGARLHVANGNIRIGSLEEIIDGGSFLIQVNSSFAPETNGNRTLGNSTFRWSTVYATNGTINTSDIRDKENIAPLTYGLNEILQLNPVTFSWKEHGEQGSKIGLIAQELQDVIKEVVVDKEWIIDEESGDIVQKEASRMGVYYSDLIPVLIKSTQELSSKNDELNLRLNEQQALIDQLISRIENLEGN